MSILDFIRKGLSRLPQDSALFSGAEQHGPQGVLSEKSRPVPAGLTTGSRERQNASGGDLVGGR